MIKQISAHFIHNLKMATLARTLIRHRLNRLFITPPRCLSNLSVPTHLPKQESFLSSISISNTWKFPQISERITFPNGIWWIPPENVIEEPLPQPSIEAPSTGQNEEKEAARLIVIRRKKMKKHKLRKLRKRMKYEWAKVRQRRELKKEKIFQAGLIAQCKVAEAFDAEAYVNERLAKLHEVILPSRAHLGLPPMKK